LGFPFRRGDKTMPPSKRALDFSVNNIMLQSHYEPRNPRVVLGARKQVRPAIHLPALQTGNKKIALS